MDRHAARHARHEQARKKRRKLANKRMDELSYRGTAVVKRAPTRRKVTG